jgi:hypothetical protein
LGECSSLGDRLVLLKSVFDLFARLRYFLLQSSLMYHLFWFNFFFFGGGGGS